MNLRKLKKNENIKFSVLSHFFAAKIFVLLCNPRTLTKNAKEITLVNYVSSFVNGLDPF